MVIAVLQHGLGNQLFQYAAGRALAERSQSTLLLDTTHFAYLTSRALDIRKLCLRAYTLPIALAKLLTPIGGTSRAKAMIKTFIGLGIHTHTDTERGYDGGLFGTGRFCRLEGFWQSERYFAHLRPKLLAELEPCAKLPASLEALSRQMAATESIALHVRRGDLVTDRRYAETVGALGADYYHQALTRLKTIVPHARVYLFSDDPAWCEKNIPPIFPMEIVSGRVTRSAVEDLTLMKRCRHFIIANSTFSWWAAWLGTDSSKQVIAPSGFFRVPRAWEKDLLPTTWETIEAPFEAMS